MIIIASVYYSFNGKFWVRGTILSSMVISIYMGFTFLDGRFFDVFTYDVLYKLLSIRFTPFFNEIPNFSSIGDWFFGLGFGRPFYIPWFEYRDNVN
ncbi:DUF6369 family protein, partial [Shewanella indica]|uniref:DUF6369 family protein n=1 Tax=Shewanella indica TaxID=768528 RepID=UPI001F218E71